MFFAANGARFGFLATVPANIGYHLAMFIAASVVGFGFFSIASQSENVFFVIKTLGALYVLWLAWKMFKSGSSSAKIATKHASFMDGVVLLALNPKAYVIFAAMFSQFMTPVAESWAAIWLFQVVLISGIYTAINGVAFICWILASDRIGKYFRDENSAKKMNMGFGLMLGLVALWLLLS